MVINCDNLESAFISVKIKQSVANMSSEDIIAPDKLDMIDLTEIKENYRIPLSEKILSAIGTTTKNGDDAIHVHRHKDLDLAVIAKHSLRKDKATDTNPYKCVNLAEIYDHNEIRLSDHPPIRNSYELGEQIVIAVHSLGESTVGYLKPYKGEDLFQPNMDEFTTTIMSELPKIG